MKKIPMPNCPSPTKAPVAARDRHGRSQSRLAKIAVPSGARIHQPNGGTDNAINTPATSAARQRRTRSEPGMVAAVIADDEPDSGAATGRAVRAPVAARPAAGALVRSRGAVGGSGSLPLIRSVHRVADADCHLADT